MVRRNLDLELLAGLVLLAALAVTATTSPLVRAAPGSFLALAAPGYALGAALVPAGGLDRFERILISVGASLCVTVVGTVALDAAGARLDTRTWCLFLSVATLACCGAAALRRRASAQVIAPLAQSAGAPSRVRRLPPRSSIALACCAVALIAAAFVLAKLPSSNVQGFTVLWALPQNSGKGDFTVGVRSEELVTKRYVLTARAGGSVVLRIRLTLLPGSSWQQSGRLTAARVAAGNALRVTLAPAESPARVYRRVHLDFGRIGG